MHGIFPILNTTFHADGSLDLESQLRLVDYLLEAGAHGLGLFGNASEGYALGEDERRTLLVAIAGHVKGRVPLVVSTGATGTDLAARASQTAQDLGANALMVLPPYYLKPGADGLMVYFEAISRAVRIPIMVQDAPLMSQVPMPAGLLVRMAREIEHVSLVKVEAPPTAVKFTQILESKPPVTLFGGLNGNFFIEEYDRGSRGMMPGSDMIPEFVRLWNLLENGAREEAWKLFVHLLPLIRFELQPGLGVSAMKHNLVAKGIIANARVRHPTSEVDAAGLQELAFLRDWMARLN
ncbi:MAG: dihydrodipicolinate synthase family protein [Bryobacteraceae bacterium]|nr:dihydrodipicolinate synthase family protein [Bryobacteraceae bacterium]